MDGEYNFRIPRFKSFSFPPTNHMVASKRISLGRCDDAALQESASKSFSQQKAAGEAMITLKIILLFLNPRTITATPWREMDGHYRNRLMKGKLGLQLFPQKHQSCLLKKNVRTQGKLSLFCWQNICASFEWLLVSCWLCRVSSNPFSSLNDSLLYWLSLTSQPKSPVHSYEVFLFYHRIFG